MAPEEPFLSILEAFSFISFDKFVQSLNAVSCVTRLSPTWKFLFQTLAVPTAFMAGPLLVHTHVCQMYQLRGAKGTGKLHVLGETFGLFCMLFFIVLCTAVLEPFDCVSHPNGAFTMRTSVEVLCNFRNDHLSLSLVASFLTFLPLAFLSLCAWLVVQELPKRIHRMDVKFIRSCSFLISRFRPGSEKFSIFLLVRNAILACAPVLPFPEAGFLLVFAVLGTNLCLAAMFQPWLSSLATYLDVLTNFGFLLIILNGSFFLETSNNRSGMLVCSLVLVCILLVFASLSISTLAEQWIRKRRKRYDFFLTHHKQSSGSVARMMKLELQQRGLAVFLDTDDLLSLSDLFGTLTQDVEALVVVASPTVLTRKWCLGEIVTANLQNVSTMVVALPDFHFPDACICFGLFL